MFSIRTITFGVAITAGLVLIGPARVQGQPPPPPVEPVEESPARPIFRPEKMTYAPTESLVLQPSPPMPSSQPTPSTAGTAQPGTQPTPGGQPFAGYEPVQDLSKLRVGNYDNTKYRWYGFVRLDGIFDFDPIGSTDNFVTSSIPVPQDRGQNFSMNPRYSRLGFDTETPIESHDWTVKTRIEMDFFNGNRSGVFGSFPLRLRFAWIDFGPFLVGQAASLFMDYDAYPNVLDYEGPPGMVLMRQPIFSVHCKPCENVKISVGIEQPYSDIQWFENGVWVVNPNTGIITTPGVGRNVQDAPDLTGNVKWTHDYGHCQVAGILRKLTFQPPVGDDLNEYGYGVNFTGTWHPWAMFHHVPKTCEDAPIWAKCRFLGQYAWGHGINRYIQDVNGLGLDGTFDPINGFRAIPAYGWFLAYEQWWAERWISNFTVGGTAWSDLTNTLPNSTYKEASYYSANIIWLPFDRLGVGLEYLYGTRENKDGQSGQAHRIQAGVQYKF